MESTAPEETVGEFVEELEYDDLPDEAIETITQAFIDTVGVLLAGSDKGAGRATTKSVGIDPKQANVVTLLGIGADTPLEQVVLRTGTASHALDYDDLSWEMSGHPSVTLVPAILALADKVGASGRDLITAYAAGFEVESAIAKPISPDHYEDGWHATATFGTFGATAAAANLLDLSCTEATQALNIAASMPAGLKRNFGSMTKPLHAGLCSRSGITASRLAADGLTADSVAVSGDGGFWDVYGPTNSEEFVGFNHWTLQEEGIHVKAYPCCYFTHTSIAAAQALREKGLDHSVIEEVKITASRGAGDALHHTDPDTGLEAKFSMEYAVANSLVREKVGLSTFYDDAINDPDVQRVREKTDFSVDEAMPYDSHKASVRIVTTDETYERIQENPPGTHDNPLTDDELRAKFEECAGTILPDTSVDHLYHVLSSLSDQEDFVAAVQDDY